MFVASRGISEVLVDNFAFRLHYRFTHYFLIISSVLIAAYQYWGNPISCRYSEGEAPPAIRDYCWASSTFTLPGFRGMPGYRNGDDDDGEKKKYYAYYQWVFVVLFGQAFIFCLPHLLWKCWEGSKMKNLVQGLNSPTLSKEDKKNQIDIAVSLLDSNRLYQNSYAYKFIFCEVFNLINIFMQIHFTNNFLNNEFSTYGHEVGRFFSMEQPDSEDSFTARAEHMVKIFPKVTKCEFKEFSPSGTITTYDVLCILPINGLNEKIFALLWFWYGIVVNVALIQLIYRVLTMTMPRFREGLLIDSKGAGSYNKTIRRVMQQCNYGDLFVLSMLKKNISEYYFEEIIDCFVNVLTDRNVND